MIIQMCNKGCDMKNRIHCAGICIHSLTGCGVDENHLGMIQIQNFARHTRLNKMPRSYPTRNNGEKNKRNPYSPDQRRSHSSPFNFGAKSISNWRQSLSSLFSLTA